MKTFGSVLGSQKGFGAGFDFIRIALAFSILAFHSIVVSGTYDPFMRSPFWIVPSILVPMFFGVSGFLITGSALRLKLHDFLINRGMRIFPALAMDIFISALLIGPLFTELPLRQYFNDPNFFQYFGSIIGLIQYDLPGVFLHNDSAGVVNQSLWTVPYEFLCYFAIALAIITRMLHRPRTLLALTILFILTPLAIELAVADVTQLPRAIVSLFFGRGSGSFQCFMLGIVVYLYRGSIPFDAKLAAGCVGVVLLLALAGNRGWANSGALNVALAPVLTYFILFVGLSSIPKVPLYSRGDYSYGIYLYGYPFQQAMIAAGPEAQSWWLNYVLTLPILTLVAMGSWHCIEKPVLTLRRKFSFVGRRLAEEQRVAGEHVPATPASPAAVTPGG